MKTRIHKIAPLLLGTLELTGMAKTPASAREEKNAGTLLEKLPDNCNRLLQEPISEGTAPRLADSATCPQGQKVVGIPQIKHYEAPGSVSLLREPLPWKLKSDKAALLIHDMQNCFLGRYESKAFLTRLVENTARIRQRCHELGIPVFYTMQPGHQTRKERGLLLDMWGPGLPGDEHARSIVQGLTPLQGKDILLLKHRYSAFKKTDLLDRLGHLKRNQLIICGVYAHIGCLFTAADAFMADIQPFVAADALGDFSLDEHQAALQHMANCTSKVLSTEELLKQLFPTDHE